MVESTAILHRRRDRFKLRREIFGLSCLEQPAIVGDEIRGRTFGDSAINKGLPHAIASGMAMLELRQEQEDEETTRGICRQELVVRHVAAERDVAVAPHRRASRSSIG